VGAFELQDTAYLPVETKEAESIRHPEHSHGKVKEECIIAFKVYDSCRRQNCLTHSELGPARSADNCDIDGHSHHAGDFIRPPRCASSVGIDQLKITKILVTDKQPSPFRHGFWDVDIEYVFEYRLTFREVGGRIIEHHDGTNSFNLKTTLFGSAGSDLVVGTDLFKGTSDSATFAATPFVWVDAKGVALSAQIVHGRGGGREHHDRGEVHVTIGLFSVLKLFRLVPLNVTSSGFCIPEECEDSGNVNPCEYFSGLDFPVDVFAPPQKKTHH